MYDCKSILQAINVWNKLDTGKIREENVKLVKIQKKIEMPFHYIYKNCPEAALKLI